MSLTALLWACLFVASAVMALVNPLFGALGYLLEYYQRPDLHWWGSDLPDLRWNFFISLVLAGTFVLRRNSLEPVRPVTHAAIGLLIILGLNAVAVSAFIAINPTLTWVWAWQFWKNVIIYALIIGVVRTPLAFDLFASAHIAGAAWWGWDALDKQRVGSRLEGIGSGDTFGSNPLAAHLVTVIPLAIVWFLAEKDWRKRLLGVIALPLILNLFILCNSRGATLGLAVAVIAGILLVRRGKRIRVAMAAIACGVALLFLADPQFIERQATTANPQDRSAQSRFSLWAGGLRMIADHPLGLGGRGYHMLSPQYVTNTEEFNGEIRSPHNTYIQAGTDWGIQGLLLFLAFIGVSIHLLRKVRRHTQSDWVFYRSLALEMGLVGTLIAGFFSVRFYGESVYWLCALAIALNRIPVPSEDHAYAAAADYPAARAVSEDTPSVTVKARQA